MHSPALESVLSNPGLPSLPTVAAEVLDLSSREDLDLREIERSIERDQAMASRVLRTVNSSYYGLSRRCGSIRQAVAYLGLETVKSLVLGFSLVRISDGSTGPEVTFDFVDYWRRSLFGASLARTIAESIRSDHRVDADEAFVTALVRDVGMVVLWRVHGDRYLQIIDMAGTETDAIIAMERRALEVDHARIGAELTRRWRFPDSISEAISAHHQASGSLDEASTLVKVVRIATATTGLVDPRGGPPVTERLRFERQLMQWFGLRPDRARDILETSLTRTRELAQTLDLEGGDLPDLDELVARADVARSELPDPPAVDDSSDSSDHDPATGLLPRNSLLPDLEQAFMDHPGSVSLMLVGIDEVRTLNERLGDAGGDAALEHVGSCIRDFTGDTPGIRGYRFVGAEIAVLMADVDSVNAQAIAEDLRSTIACRPVRVSGRDGGDEYCGIHVTIGVGTRSGASPVPPSPDGLLRAAMCAVASGRRRGGDCVEFGDTDGFQTSTEAA